jgi:hypothetical protein
MMFDMGRMMEAGLRWSAVWNRHIPTAEQASSAYR